MNSRFFALAHDMWCITTPAGVYSHVNPAWTRVLGWDASDVEGHSFREFLHPDDLAAANGSMADLASGRARDTTLVRMRRADGSYSSIDWRANVDAETGEIFAAGRDVSEQVAVQQRLVARERILGELVAQQSHEIEELLARLAEELHDSAVQHIVAALMFLEADSGLHPGIADAAAQMQLTLAALRRIMTGLEEVDEDLANPGAGFRAVAMAVAEQFAAEIRCDVEGSTPLPSEVGRTAYRVAREGLVNACKYARPGPIELRVELGDAHASIEVRDPGSPPRAAAAGELGTGHGLMLLEARVRAHGGSLVFSRAADGSALTVELPLEPPTTEETTVPELDATPSAGVGL